MIDHTIPNNGRAYVPPQNITSPYSYVPYTPHYTNTIRPTILQNSSSTLIYVKGINEGKNYPQQPSTTIIMWDSEVDKFYRKSTDERGNTIEFESYSYTKDELEEENQNDLLAVMMKQIEDLSAKVDAMAAKTEMKKLASEPVTQKTYEKKAGGSRYVKSDV